MKKFTLIFFIAIFSVLTVYGEDKSSLDDPTVVDDPDKTSGRVNDIISSVEMALKALDVYNTAKDAKKTFDQVKKFKNLKDVKGFAAQKLKEAVSQYKSCKWSLFTWVSHVSNKMADVMAKCNDRVNMWRSTEPMLINYYKSMGRLSNNTLQVFKDFELSDMIDIDRKWSKKMEKQLNQDKRFIYSFFAFTATHFPSDYYQKKYSSLFMPLSVEKQLTGNTEDMEAYLAIKDGVHEFNRIPYQTLAFSTDAILAVREIANQAHGSSKTDPSVSAEQDDMERIEVALTTPNATYNDVMDNGVLIQSKRAEVSMQRTQLQQIYSELQTRYSRLLMRRQERMAMEYEDVDNTLNKLINGGNFESIDAARVKRFGENAGVIEDNL